MGQRADLDISRGRLAVPKNGRSPEQIEAEIRKTRLQLEETVEDLKERFTSEHIKGEMSDRVKMATVDRARDVMNRTTERAKDMMSRTSVRAKDLMDKTGDTAKEVSSTMVETLRENTITRTVIDNPIPAALAGLGLGWLIFKGIRGTDGYSSETEWERGFESEPYEERASGGFETATEKAKDTFEQARSKASEAFETTKEKAGALMEEAKMETSELSSEARYRAEALRGRYQGFLEERPLVLVAAALLVGMALGLSLPESKPEHRFMGEAKEKIFGKAKEAAHEAMEKVGRVAEEVKHTAGQKAKEEGLVS
jgi:ElaB/YqjD/DUF883 family membrane-anchored ribosome-binding protein